MDRRCNVAKGPDVSATTVGSTLQLTPAGESFQPRAGPLKRFDFMLTAWRLSPHPNPPVT
jgi:hypothetical protein